MRFASAVQLAELVPLAKRLYTAHRRRADPAISLGNVTRVRDRTTIEHADIALFEAFLQDEGVVFSFPGIVDPDGTDLISFRESGKRRPLDGVDLDPFRNELRARVGTKAEPSANTLRNANVEISTDDGQPVRKVPLYRCLVGSVTVRKKDLVLFEGAWHDVNKAYLSEVVSEVGALFVPQGEYPSRTAKDFEEADYNVRASEHLNGVCLDRTSITSGGNSGIEPCDIIWREDDTLVFTHVKPENSSSTLSHLFYQAQVATTALLLDENAREQLKSTIIERSSLKDRGLPAVREGAPYKRNHRLSSAEKTRRRLAGDDLVSSLEQRITSRKFRIKFAIIHSHKRKAAGGYRTAEFLPVFSRISLARAARVFRQLDIPMTVRYVDDDRTA